MLTANTVRLNSLQINESLSDHAVDISSTKLARKVAEGFVSGVLKKDQSCRPKEDGLYIRKPANKKNR